MCVSLCVFVSTITKKIIDLGNCHLNLLRFMKKRSGNFYIGHSQIEVKVKTWVSPFTTIQTISQSYIQVIWRASRLALLLGNPKNLKINMFKTIR